MDELDKLRAALRNVPAPDEAAKQASLRVAEENFDRLQESDPAMRPTQTAPQTGGVLKGLSKMFMKPNLKPMMLATSSLVIVGVGVMLVGPVTKFASNPTKTETVIPTATSEKTATNRGVQLSGRAEVALTENAIPGPEFSADLDVNFSDSSKKQNGQTSEPSVDQDLLASPEASQIFLEGRFGTIAMGDIDGEITYGAVKGSSASGLSKAAPAQPQLRDRLPRPQVAQANDRFANAETNPLKVAAEDPVSTFSIDVDTASYSWMRASLSRGQLPDPASIRVEELVNYFPYDYPTPTGDAPFQPTVSVSQTPWNPDTQLMHIAIQGAEVETRPPLNLVFLIDTSGSMQDANKLPLLVQSFRLMLGQLRADDQVAIVTYAGSAGVVLDATSADQPRVIEDALRRLSAGGSTAGGEGLRVAYDLAAKMGGDGEVSRVILATDGDFNVGLQSNAELKGFVTEQRKSGTYLSVLGFGRGNVNDALMQTLAQNGNGQAAYIDTLAEAQKMLVDQLSGALFPIAQDVKIQVEFNPATVAEYRLIGYETRALRREDFNNDKVDAGEIGAGHTVTALYEVTPVGSAAALTDPLRFGAVTQGGNETDLAFLRLRYKEPGGTVSQLLEKVIPVGTTQPSSEARFAAAIAGFGQLLRGSVDLGDWSYTDAIAQANEAKGDDPYGYRTEAVQLMRLADSLSR